MSTYEDKLRLATQALQAEDRVLGRHIAKIGPCGLKAPTRPDPFGALVSSIAHQQLTGKAAKTILGRLHEKLEARGALSPETLARTRLTTLRSCGFSGAKSAALIDVAKRTLDGTVPSARELRRMSDEEIVERLTSVRGIGVWSAQMLLIFHLGRLDVLPVDDYGVRKGYAALYGGELPSPRDLLVQGERWQPYRSVAAWYLWRALDKPAAA